LGLFIGSAVVLRQSVFADGEVLLFPIGCGLFLLSVLIPALTPRARRSASEGKSRT